MRKRHAKHILITHICDSLGYDHDQRLDTAGHRDSHSMIKTVFLLGLFLMQNTTAKPVIGTLEGEIFTADGKPAPNMILFVQGVFPPATLKTEVQSDAEGHYRVSELEPGQYVLYPYNNSDQYPIRNNMFLSNSPERINLKSGEHLRKDLVLPPAAGVIEGTTVSSNGLPLSRVDLVLCHADDAKRSAEIHTSDTGTFRYIVPSGERLSVLIEQPSGIALQETNIVLKPGERREIKFVLRQRSDIHGARCIPFRPGS